MSVIINPISWVNTVEALSTQPQLDCENFLIENMPLHQWKILSTALVCMSSNENIHYGIHSNSWTNRKWRVKKQVDRLFKTNTMNGCVTAEKFKRMKPNSWKAEENLIMGWTQTADETFGWMRLNGWRIIMNLVVRLTEILGTLEMRTAMRTPQNKRFNEQKQLLCTCALQLCTFLCCLL